MILVTVRCWGQIVEHNLTADKSEFVEDNTI